MTDRQHVRTLSAIYTVAVLLTILLGVVNAIRLDAHHRAHDQLVVACASLPSGSYMPRQCEGMNP